MGEIFVAVVKVQGDSETINQALRMASDVIAQRSAPAVEIPAAPVAALLSAAPNNNGDAKKLFCCKVCPETFTAVGKLAAHTRALHRAKPAPKLDAVEPTKPGEGKNGKAAKELFWCPQKNCAASFSKEGRRKQHLQRAHGITL